MTPGRLLEIAEQHPPETQEQTSGKAVFGSVPGHTEGQKMPGPLDHQSATGTNCATECAVRAPESSARGPAADPIADLCAQIKSFLADAPQGMPHEGYRYGELLSFAADAIERLTADLRAEERGQDNLRRVIANLTAENDALLDEVGYLRQRAELAESWVKE